MIGAQKENAALVAALIVLGLSNLVLTPLYGVLGDGGRHRDGSGSWDVPWCSTA